MKWAIGQRHACGLDIPPPVRTEPSAPLDNDKRIDIAKKLLSDTTLALDLRVAGLLTVLFAQPPPSRRSEWTKSPATRKGFICSWGASRSTFPDGSANWSSSSPRPVVHTPTSGRGSSPWLFPGRHPEQHLSASTARNRLQKVGIPGRATQHAALHDLSQALHEAAISRLLGISIVSADRWKTGGQWGSYAAVVAQRSQSRQAEPERRSG
ncbi:hypothetical protein [Streptomyces sp. NPDC002671]